MVVDAFIDQAVATRAISQLLFLEARDASAGITLHVDSDGGSVSAAPALCDALVRLKTPVSTVCTGYCAGMATVVLACGRPGSRGVARLLHQPGALLGRPPSAALLGSCAPALTLNMASPAYTPLARAFAAELSGPNVPARVRSP